jgi:2-iminoacetate synthase
VLFAPLYVSDFCVNDCAYCNFHLTNEAHRRTRLNMEAIKAETECLIGMGHKRVLVEFGEDSDNNSIDYICDSIRAVYSARTPKGNIRRVNVNIAATSTENYRRLRAENIGTYQLFQETYHRPTFERLHKGPKANFDRQLTAHCRAFEAGLDDFGIGVLFGLYDWRFEVLSLVAHAQYMEKKLGVGPHTISVPRFRSAPGIDYEPEYPVSDEDFLRLIAILRLAVPYTGMILSTREPPALRSRAFRLGISQASAASICTPGGYSAGSVIPAKAGIPLTQGDSHGQFSIADDRPVDEVIKSVIAEGLMPSFCTACYRVGRTGEKFMEMAKPGDIHNFCRPNSILTFAEYLEDFADNKTRLQGYQLIEKFLGQIENERLAAATRKKLADVKAGKRDLFF